MNSCHNVSFGTGYEIFDKNGTLVKSNFDGVCCGSPDAQIEGELEVKVQDDKGGVVSEIKQPMRSFVKEFMWFLNSGARLNGAVHISSGAGLTLGCGSNPTTIGMVALQDYVVNQYYRESVSDVNVACNFREEEDALILTTEAICTWHHSENQIYPDVPVTEIGFEDYRRTGSYTHVNLLVARDVLPEAVVMRHGRTLRIIYKFKFPKSSQKSITMNWIKNMAAHISSQVVYDTGGNPRNTTAKNYNSSNINDQLTFSAARMCTLEIGVNSDDVTSEDTNVQAVANESAVLRKTNLFHPDIEPRNAASAIEVIGNTARYIISRDFTNNTTDQTLHFHEAGLFGSAPANSSTYGLESSTAAASFLLARWRLDNIALEPGSTLRVYFQPQVTC